MSVIRWTLAAAVAALSAIGAGCDAGGSGGEQGRAETLTVRIPGQGAQSGDRGGDRKPQPDRGSPPEVPGGGECEGANEPTTDDNLRQAEIAVRCLTNAARGQKGLDALRFDERLARAAATRSNDMAKANFFGHQGPGNSSVRTAVERTGWIPQGKSWLLGENIGWAARGRATPADLVRGWLDSPRHRANMLSEDFTRLGVGAVAAVPKKDAQPGATFTQVFGARGDAARRAQTG